MTIKLLVKRMKLQHAPHHNLKSLFFVLIYICTNLSGPGAVQTQEELHQFSSIPLSSWFKTSNSLCAIGTAKLGAMCELDLLILTFFVPYFKDLKECVGKLLKAMYSSSRMPSRSSMKHCSPFLMRPISQPHLNHYQLVLHPGYESFLSVPMTTTSVGCRKNSNL